MLSLPTEVWSHIATFLRKRDLTKLARTSRFFLETSQQELYKDVTLASSSPQINQALECLSSKPALAARLQKLKITSPLEPEDRELVLDIFLKATSLRSFRVDGPLFETLEQQDAFVRSAEERSTPLLELKCDSTDFPVEYFRVSRLRHIDLTVTSRMFTFLHLYLFCISKNSQFLSRNPFTELTSSVSEHARSSAFGLRPGLGLGLRLGVRCRRYV